MHIQLHLVVICLLICVFGCSAAVNPDLESEEKGETEFFSNETKGGIDGTILKVTNLNAKGEGSLRAALEADGPRLVVFEVGGVIDLEMDKITIKSPFVTIAGHTAPSPGITIIRGGIFITTHDIIIKHIAVRPGDAGQPKKSGWEPDGISAFGENVHHLWVDHCSITWAVDENLTASGPRTLGPGRTSNHVTFSNNIIAEGLYESSHAKGAHSMGTLIHDNCTEIAIVGNLFANNFDRNPYFKANTTGIIVNNLIFNPGSSAIRLGFPKSEWENVDLKTEVPVVSIVGNVFFHGKDSGIGLPLVKSDGKVYLDDNLAYDVQMKKLSQAGGNIVRLKQKPYWLEGLNELSGIETENSVLKNVGARPGERDPIDQRIIQGVLDKEGRVLNSQDEVGGYPERESTYRKLEVPDDNIQEWLDEMEKTVL